MRILFQDDSLEDLCREERKQKKELGADCAKKLRARLADLVAAARVTDLVAGKPHPLDKDLAGKFAVSLDGGRRLVFEPAHDPLPVKEGGGIDWASVTVIRIVFVGDYHD